MPKFLEIKKDRSQKVLIDGLVVVSRNIAIGCIVIAFAIVILKGW